MKDMNQADECLESAVAPVADQRTEKLAAPPVLALVGAWQSALLLAFLYEVERIKARLLFDATPGNWWDSPAFDGTFCLPLLLLAPFCWGFACRRKSGDVEASSELTDPTSPRIGLFPSTWPTGTKMIFGSLLVAAVSLLSSWRASEIQFPNETPATRIIGTLPLVQDEFSYLLQARTFLAGRWWWEGPKRAAELFHQTHVLNEGRFASRYFPGTGLWLTPWVAIGDPVWGARFAGMLACIGIFWIGCELRGFFSGLIAGGLAAVSPGMAIMNNLMLSHGPTLIGLVLFLFGFLRFMRKEQRRWIWLAGSGLAFAMLCRPLTAAAIGLPFGVWFFLKWFRCDSKSSKLLWDQFALALAIPILLGLAFVGWQNRSITNELLTTPYQLYTQLYTPRHAFGFNNGTTTPEFPEKVLHDYNNWAANLDFALALKNVRSRLLGSFAWSLGVIPLMLTAVYCLITLPEQALRIQLLFASIISLHAAHIPYWLDGILNHHYVFESGVLWVLIFAVISTDLLAVACSKGHYLFPCWWGCLVGISIFINFVPVGSTRAMSRLQAGWESFRRPTVEYRRFEEALAQQLLELPALVLVHPRGDDLHVQYVRNLPPFEADVLIGMERPDLYSPEEVQVLFPERNLYRYNVRTRTLNLVVPRIRESVGAAP